MEKCSHTWQQVDTLILIKLNPTLREKQPKNLFSSEFQEVSTV